MQVLMSQCNHHLHSRRPGRQGAGGGCAKSGGSLFKFDRMQHWRHSFTSCAALVHCNYSYSALSEYSQQHTFHVVHCIRLHYVASLQAQSAVLSAPRNWGGVQIDLRLHSRDACAQRCGGRRIWDWTKLTLLLGAGHQALSPLNFIQSRIKPTHWSWQASSILMRL